MIRSTLVVLLLLAPMTARADEISSEEDVCRGQALGAACNFDGTNGACRDGTCAGIDYSGGKPKPIDRPCRRCVAGEAKAEPATVPAATTRAEASSPDASGCALGPGPASLGSVGLGLALLWLTRRRSAG
jgi:hypothetical protein